MTLRASDLKVGDRLRMVQGRQGRRGGLEPYRTGSVSTVTGVFSDHVTHDGGGTFSDYDALPRMELVTNRHVKVSYSEEHPIVSVEYGGIVFDNKGHEETGRFRIAVGSSDFGTFTKESAIEFLEAALKMVKQ